jgi:hypothetical protein
MKITRTKWWKLKEDVSQVFKNKVIAEGPWNKGNDADNIWKEMATHIRKMTIDVFGVTRGINVNLKTLGDGMMMYKRQSMRKKNATNVYITTGVMKMYKSTKKSEETQRKL